LLVLLLSLTCAAILAGLSGKKDISFNFAWIDVADVSGAIAQVSYGQFSPSRSKLGLA
jgi:hypothetical protein